MQAWTLQDRNCKLLWNRRKNALCTAQLPVYSSQIRNILRWQLNFALLCLNFMLWLLFKTAPSQCLVNESNSSIVLGTCSLGNKYIRNIFWTVFSSYTMLVKLLRLLVFEDHAFLTTYQNHFSSNLFWIGYCEPAVGSIKYYYVILTVARFTSEQIGFLKPQQSN